MDQVDGGGCLSQAEGDEFAVSNAGSDYEAAVPDYVDGGGCLSQADGGADVGGEGSLSQADGEDFAMSDAERHSEAAVPDHDMRIKKMLNEEVQKSEMPAEDSVHHDRVVGFLSANGGAAIQDYGMHSSIDFDIKGKRKLQDEWMLQENLCHGMSIKPSTTSDNRLHAAKRQRKLDDHNVFGQPRTKEAHVAPSLHCLGIDLIGEIFGWLCLEDLARVCSASQYLTAIGNLPSFRRQLRTQHRSRHRTGPFLGVLIQRGGQICLRSPALRNFQNAAVSVNNFLLTESKGGMLKGSVLWDSRDGRLLLSKDKQFLVCNPFKEECYIMLPMCPGIADEELLSASFLPDDATHHYIVMVLATDVKNRSVALLKRYHSADGEWSCISVECAFQFPPRSKLRSAAPFTNGCLSILNPKNGVIYIDIQNFMLRTISLPLNLDKTPQRHQLLCKNREGHLCLVTVRVVAGTPGRGKTTLVSIYVFDSMLHKWSLMHEWTAPKSIPSLNLLGFAEGHSAVIVGSGWHDLYMLNIDDGSFSKEICDTGAKYEVLTYEVEYPSTSWWTFTK